MDIFNTPYLYAKKFIAKTMLPNDIFVFPRFDADRDDKYQNYIISYPDLVAAIAAAIPGAGVTSVTLNNLNPLFTVANTGTVTDPIFTFTAVPQNANLVYAGPAAGPAAAPTFRALTLADMPAGIDAQDLANVLSVGNSTGNQSIISPDNSSVLEVINGSGSLAWVSGSVQSIIFLEPLMARMTYTDGVTLADFRLTATTAQLFHNIYMEFNAPNYKFTQLSANTAVYINSLSELVTIPFTIDGDILTLSGGIPTWQAAPSTGPISTTAGNTLLTCITDIFVQNVNSCSPLNINATNGQDIIMVASGGNVGIGTITPIGARLCIVSSTLFTNGINVDTTGQSAYGIISKGNIGIEGQTDIAAGVGVHGNVPNATGYAGRFTGGYISVQALGRTSDSTTYAIEAQNSSFNKLFVVRNDGNVGIGTNAPAAKLNLIGDFKFSGATQLDGISNTFSYDIGVAIGAVWHSNVSIFTTNNSAAAFGKGFQSHVTGVNMIAGYFLNITSLNRVSFANTDWAIESAVGKMYITDGIAINTFSPNAKLHVVTSGILPAVRLGNGTYEIDIRPSGSSTLSELNTTNIGWQVSSTDGYFRLNRGSGAGPVLIYTNGTATGLAFSGNVAGTEHMRITSAGLVGIGITAPTAKLHIVGDTGMWIASPSGGYGKIQIIPYSPSQLYASLVDADDTELRMGGNTGAYAGRWRITNVANNARLAINKATADATLDVVAEGSGYSTAFQIKNSSANVNLLMFDNNELYFDYGVAGQTTKHSSGRWDFANTVTIGGPTNTGIERFQIKGSGNTSSTYAVDVLSSGGSSNFRVKDNGTVAMISLQTGNAGLASGDLYVDTAANILANGDLIIGRKV